MKKTIAIIHSSADSDWIEGQIVGLDLIVDGSSMTNLVEEIEHVIVSVYHIATRLKREPFANISTTGTFGDRFPENTHVALDLNQEIWETLLKNAPNVVITQVSASV